jgi:CRP/FNR family transcriptional regulator, cyclic AMP receptor protein
MYLTKLWYLKNVDMLKLVREANLDQLTHFTAMSHVKAHQDVYFPEQGSNHVYIVQEGHVRLSTLDDEGSLIVMEILRPGEIFGKLALEGENIPNEFAEAADDVTVCAMSRTGFETLLGRFPGLHFHLTKSSLDRFEEYEERISDLVFKDSTRRIISFIARYGQTFNGSGDHPITVERPLSPQDIANLTGTSPAAFVLAMNDLQKKELVECKGQSLVIRDLAALKMLAE